MAVVKCLVLFLFGCCGALSNKQVHNTSCFCVVPESNITDVCDCPSECSCGSLSQFVGAGAFAKNDTTVYFLAGNHILKQVANVTGSVYNLTNLRFTGGNETGESYISIESPVAEIWCEGGEAGFYFGNIENLTVVGLGFHNCGFTIWQSLAGAVICRGVYNLYMCGVEITQSRGWGLSCNQAYGNSTITHSRISHGESVLDHTGGNFRLVYDEIRNGTATFSITHSNITAGFNAYNVDKDRKTYGGGAHVYIRTTDTVAILFDHVRFVGNKAKEGGNAAVLYRTVQRNAWPGSVTFSHCLFLSGLARFGGGLYLSMAADIQQDSSVGGATCPMHAVRIHNCVIRNNSADLVGAGMYVQLNENTELVHTVNISFEDTVFDNNNNLATIHSRGGSAVNLINFHIPSYKPHRLIQYNMSFVSCNFTRNGGRAASYDSVGRGTLYAEENALMTLRNCIFEDNNCTGITTVHSNIIMQGHTVLRNNRGFNGGGMVMCANSILYFNLSEEVDVLIENCHAENFGGGIYAEFECSQAVPPCFFQVSNLGNYSKTLFLLRNNTAVKAGTALYGGAVENCYEFETITSSGNKSEFFRQLFDIRPAKQNYLSNISSNPQSVCFCDSAGVPQCSERKRYFGSVYPGGTLTVSVVVVGQLDGPVPGIVLAFPDDLVKAQQSTHKVGQSCTPLEYTILSDKFTLNQSIYLSMGSTDTASVEVIATVNSCPLGFELLPGQRRCGCAGWFDDLQGLFSRAVCSITNKTVHRCSNSTWWIGASNGSTAAVYGEYCPFDYCITEDIDIQINESDFEDSQCAYNRSGALCGECRGNLSNVLGSNSCKVCQDRLNILRVVGLVLLFALLGIILVFLVGILDITVSEGTLNAIVFYMNVLWVNSSIFFNSPKAPNRLSKLLKLFVLWMNLDFGFEVCFYSGMTAIGKIALQFAFPLYLCVLSGLIIYLSHKSSAVTNLFGKNVVKILATIIFHFYAKILRTVIDILRMSIKSYTDQSSGIYHTMYVWTVDGNIPFLHEKHTFLFATAVFVVAVTLPYTLALLFIQCLRRKSDMKVLFWVNKLKPLFDAYTGPYKDKYHFWTGFLLMVRILLFIAIAANTTKGEVLSLVLILTTTAVLFVFIQPGIYKWWPLNIVEAFTYANLSVLAAVTLYDLRFNYTNNVAINSCVGSMFLLFCGIIVYHILKKVSVTRRWGLMKVWLLDRRWPWMKRKPIRSLILPYVDPDNDEYLSSSEGELDPILHNAPPVARYDEYREPLIETTRTD